MTREELIVFCEREIRDHSARVRVFLDLLQAARLLPEDFGNDEERDT